MTTAPLVTAQVGRHTLLADQAGRPLRFDFQTTARLRAETDRHELLTCGYWPYLVHTAAGRWSIGLAANEAEARRLCEG